MQAQMREYGSVMQSAMDTAKGLAQSAAEAVKDAMQTVADAATHAKDRVTGVLAATMASGPLLSFPIALAVYVAVRATGWLVNALRADVGA